MIFWGWNDTRCGYESTTDLWPGCWPPVWEWPRKPLTHDLAYTLCVLHTLSTFHTVPTLHFILYPFFIPYPFFILCPLFVPCPLFIGCTFFTPWLLFKLCLLFLQYLLFILYRQNSHYRSILGWGALGPVFKWWSCGAQTHLPWALCHCASHCASYFG